MNFNNILIGSEDPQRLTDYYTKLFGEPTWSDGSYTVWQLGSGSFTVGKHDQVGRLNLCRPRKLIALRIDFEELQARDA